MSKIIDAMRRIRSLTVATANGFSGSFSSSLTPVLTLSAIASNTITLAQMADIATLKVIGRTTAGTGVPEALSITGTGNVVFSSSPTLTGTIGAAALTLSSTIVVTGTSTLTGNVGINTAPAANQGLRLVSTLLTGTEQYGVVAVITGTSAATTGITGYFCYAETVAASFTCPAVHGVLIDTIVKGSGSTITVGYGLKINDQTASSTNYAIHTSAGLVRFGGAVNCISTLSVSSNLDVTGTSTLTGNVGINTAASASQSLRIVSTSLTGTEQYSNVNVLITTSAATTSGIGLYVYVETATASFTCASTIGIKIDSVAKGAGSTITNNYGLKVENQAVAGATNYAFFSGTGSVSLGDILFLRTIKSGATQVAAGAAANEVWKTAGHATLADNVLMIGV